MSFLRLGSGQGSGRGSGQAAVHKGHEHPLAIQRQRKRIRKRVAIVTMLCLAFGAALIGQTPNLHAQSDELTVRVTFYTLKGQMASGLVTHKDAAACSDWLPFGTQLMFEDDGYVVTCEDRGRGDWYWGRWSGHDAWVDVWAPSHAWGIQNVERDYGLTTKMRIIRWGW